MLDNLGLSSALQSYCADYGRVTGVDCEALVDGDVNAAGPMQAIAVFRIVQESLNNIAKYAKASQVIVHLAREGDTLSLEITDDGVGIDLDAVSKPRSHGLLGMRERALLLGGTLQVKRGINNRGTCVEACIPVGSHDEPGEGLREQPRGLPASGQGAPLSAPHPSEGGRIPSSPPYSTRPHTPQDLDGQLR
jgi:signal transduction histidine kinase